MADNLNAAEQKEKLAIDYPETGQQDSNTPLDDSKAKFINGGSSLEDTKVEIGGSVSDTSFTGLGKEELKKYAEDPFWVRLRWFLFIVFWVGWVSMLVSAIVIIILAPRCPKRPDLKWYHKDVAYNIYAKSFLDETDQDGYGDLEGIEKKEEYVTGLHVKTFWLSSILKTETNNDKAVLDYKALDEKFGTIESLKAFCKKLVKEGRRVIMDLIPNQTSRNHTWFIKSQQKDGKYSDYYIWAGGPNTLEPNDWKREDGSGKIWVWDEVREQYYLSQFDGTADLNLTNEHVMAEFRSIIQFWASKGISGFHINDLEYLTENPDHTENNAENSQTKNFMDNAIVVNNLREIVDGLDNKHGREKLLFGTVTSTNPNHMRMYAREKGLRGLHVVSVMLDDLTRYISAQDLQTKLEPYVNGSTSFWLGWRLSSARAGSQRVYSRVGADRMTIAFALQALLPGSAFPYYGDEVAVEDGSQLQRKTVTPMQWSKGPNSGFTKGTPWLPVSNGYRTRNVDSMTAQLKDGSLLNSFQSLNKIRLNESVQFGKTMFCSSGNLLVFARNAPGFDFFLVVANFGPATAHKFAGTECVGRKEEAKLVFHSHHAEHEDTKLDLKRAIHIDKNEVLVFKLSA